MSSVGFSVDLTKLHSGSLHLGCGLFGIQALQTIPIVSVACRYGGRRFYFSCPVTGARVEVLALVDGRFISRKAARLTYASQSDGDFDRLVRARVKLEERTFGTNGHPRPRGRNQQRLFERWRVTSQAADSLFQAEVGRRFGCGL